MQQRWPTRACLKPIQAEKHRNDFLSRRRWSHFCGLGFAYPRHYELYWQSVDALNPDTNISYVESGNWLLLLYEFSSNMEATPCLLIWAQQYHRPSTGGVTSSLVKLQWATSPPKRLLTTPQPTGFNCGFTSSTGAAQAALIAKLQ